MAKKREIMRVSIMVTAEVEREEWMKRYGDHITKNLLVPEVTLANAIKKAAKDKLESLGIPTLAVDKPYNTKTKINKGLHS